MTTIADATAAISQLYTAVGRRIRTAREARGHTQAELGTAVGLSRASVANVEAGVQRTPFHVMIAIAQALHVDPEQLLFDAELPELAPVLPVGTAGLRRRLNAARDEIEALLNAIPTVDEEQP
jgi:transcriptional regulator with XRE-family HTH domain